MSRRWVAAGLAAAMLVVGCPDEGGGGGASAGGDAVDAAGGDGGGDAATGDAGGDGSGGDTTAPPGLGVDEAQEAEVVSTVAFQRSVATTVAAGPWVFLLYADKDLAVLDLSDPAAPVEHGPITTAARVLAVAWDEASGIAYVADASGEVQAIDLSSLVPAAGGPVSPGARIATGAPLAALGKLTVPTLDKEALGLARVGDRLFILSGATLQPLAVTRSQGAVSLGLEAPVALPAPATHLVAGGGALFVGGGGIVTSWRPGPGGALAKERELEVGGELRGLATKGSRVLIASKGVGLQVADFGPPTPALVWSSAEVDDVTDLALFGRTVVLGLEREAVTALDVSDFAAPRALVTNKGKRPGWVAVSGGTLFFGDAQAGAAAGVPPFVSASIPGPTREAMPRRRLVPVTFSKAVDPASVSAATVRLTCGGAPVEGEPVLDPTRRTVRFRPTAALPAGASCSLDVGDVADDLGLPVAGTGTIDFTTASDAEEAPVANPKSQYPHTVDGGFTDWEPGAAEHEWWDVTAAKGMYTYFYADFDGESLWILNDWFYNGDAVEPDCYNQFYVYTGGGAETWDIRAYGDQHVEVRRNGELVDPESEGVEGGAAFGPSPNLEEPHTMYEIRLPASPGAFSVQLHDPGPSFACTTLEQEPTPMSGDLTAGDAPVLTIAPPDVAAPAAVTLVSPQSGASVAPPVMLVWERSEDAVGTMVQAQVSTSAEFAQGDLVVDVLTYGSSYTVPAGLLGEQGTFHWRAIAWTTAGQAASEVWTFSIGGQAEGPVAVDDEAATPAGTAVVVDVLANDTSGDPQSLRIIEVTQGGHGTVDIGSGTVTYAPAEGFAGEDAFTYTITDSTALTSTATVSVTVTEAQAGGLVALDANLSNCCGFQDVVTGDFDGDGDVDLAGISNEGEALSLFPSTLAQGQVGFAERVDLPFVAGSLAAADLDQDGSTDLVVGTDGALTVVLGVAEGQPLQQAQKLAFPATGFPVDIAIGDLDADGRPDVVAASIANLTYLVNRTADGEVAFQAASRSSPCTQPRSLAVGRIDLDDYHDIVQGCNNGASVFRNGTSGPQVGFWDPAPVQGIGAEPVALAAGDLNADGRDDLAVASGIDPVVALVLNTSGEEGFAFAQPTTIQLPGMPVDVVLGDLDGGSAGDGDLAVVTKGTATEARIYHNLAKPGAEAVELAILASAPLPGTPYGLAAADLDGNGLADLATAIGDAVGMSVLLNNPGLSQ